MDTLRFLILVGVAGLIAGGAGTAAPAARVRLSSLEAEFAAPPAAARPYVWWHWCGPNYSLEGITRDLEAMQRAGIGGATLFNITSGVQESHAPLANNPWPQQTYRSPAYWAALRHAAVEAERLGLELGLHNSVGYSTTGGPWIDEERSMQHLVWSVAEVSGGAGASAEAAPGAVLASLTLPRPSLPPFRGWGASGRTLSFYRDVAVLAVPVPAETPVSGVTPAMPSPPAPGTLPPVPVLPLAAVRDLTADFSAADQTLRWSPPPGRWRIYRFGHASTGAAPHPVPEELLGRTLEADKMSRVQTQAHWRAVLDPLKQHLGRLAGDSLRHVLIDSYEAGEQNWTPGFREEFRQRKGYDPLPWLVTLAPVVTGDRRGRPALTLDSADQTTRFEWDYRQVIADLYREHGWEPAAELVRAAGLRLDFEAYGGPFDTVAASALADVPMVEFWTGGKTGASPTVVGAARAAGRAIVAAEAFTGRPETSRWSETPAGLKASADRAFATGVNRLVLHHWVHQPFDDRYQPGLGMGWWGTHFSRYQTWAEPGRAFFRYLARVQALLQRGEPPAEWVNVGAALGAGGDVIPWSVFMNTLRVDHGRIVLPSRRSYPFVHVPHTGALEPAAVRRIAALLAQGAVVVARRPERSPSLSGWPTCDAEVGQIAREVWGEANGALAPEGRRVGAGRLFDDLAAAQRALALVPPVRREPGGEGELLWQLRLEGSSRLCFVANPSSTPARGTLSFAVDELQPEWWEAETGAMQPAAFWHVQAGRTYVAVALAPGQSGFVVLRQKRSTNFPRVTAIEAPAGWELVHDEADQPVVRSAVPLQGQAVLSDERRVPFTLTPAPAPTLTGYWNVELVPPLGGGQRIELYTLTSLAAHADPAVRYFSGTAIYRTRFTVDPAVLAAGRRLRLDLGDVRDLATVRVNGREIGVLWHPPFGCDVTEAVRLGENQLEIAVTNTWHNRLVGDEQHPADFAWGTDRGPERGRALAAFPDWFLRGQPRPSKGRVGFVTWYYHRADTPLLPAGLLGPVRFVSLAEQVLVREPTEMREREIPDARSRRR